MVSHKPFIALISTCLLSFVFADLPSCSGITPFTAGVGGGNPVSFTCSYTPQTSDATISIEMCGVVYSPVSHTWNGATHTSSISWNLPSVETGPTTCSLNVSAAGGGGVVLWRNVYSNVITFSWPAASSFSPSTFDAMSGGSLTVTGNYFGYSQSYWCWYQVINNCVDSASVFTSYSDTQMIIPICPGQGSNLNLYNHFDPTSGCNAYSTYSSVVTYTNPPSFNGTPFPSSALNTAGGHFLIAGINFPTDCSKWSSAKLHSAAGYYSDVALTFYVCTSTGINFIYPAHTSTVHNFDLVVSWGEEASIVLALAVYYA